MSSAPSCSEIESKTCKQMQSVGERFCGLLRTLGRGGAFDEALFDTLVAPHATISEEKKELSATGYRAKLAWMHGNGYVAEGVSCEPCSDGQSFIFFVREGRVLAMRRSDQAAEFLASHPFLPSAATAPRLLPEDRFGFLVVCRSATVRARPADESVAAKPGKTVPELRPVPEVQCVVSYEPGPVQLFDRKDKV